MWNTIIYLTVILSSQSVDCAYIGQVNFLPVGQIATPVFYKHMALQLNLGEAWSAPDVVKERVDELLEEARTELELNVTDARFEYMLSRIRPSKQRLVNLARNLSRFKKLMETQVKRDMGGTLFGILGSLIGIGSALYTHDKVQELAQEVHNNAHGLLRTKEALRQMENFLASWKEEQFDRDQEEQFIDQVISELEGAANHVDDLIHGFYSLAEKKIHPSMIPIDLLENITSSGQG